MDGKDLVTGVADPQFSLTKLVGVLLNFSKDITQIWCVGEQLAVEVYLTPKTHTEIACKGVEYYWAFDKCMLFQETPPNKEDKERDRKYFPTR